MNENQQIELAHATKRLDAVMKLAEKMTNETGQETIEAITDIIMELSNKINELKNGKD